MIKKLLIAAFALIVISQFANAQLITAIPAFPTDQDQVVITFDASLGNAGLSGYNGSVYAHTGLITENSGSGSDWKYVKAGWGENIPACQMSKVGNDLYELTIGSSIQEYYGAPAGELIEQMAFVFRSADGSLTGKTESGGDIYYDVYESGLNIQISLPEESTLIVGLNDIIHIEGSTSSADSTFLYNNDDLVYSTANATFEYDLQVVQDGNNVFSAIAKSGSQTAEDSFNYYVRPELIIEDVPEGIIDGINYIDDNTVILSLFAPEKEYVFAIGDFSNWTVNNDVYMKRSSDGNRYWIELNGLVTGQEYIYQYFIDGDLRIGDPYADKVSDPWHDSEIPNSTYPNLIEYPDGQTTGIATVFQTAQEEYVWQNTDFATPDSDKLVIYELLVRDFTEGRTFNDLIDTLDYLTHLGVNAIELMPVSEFEGNNSWGYNPNYYFAVDKYYGPKDTFKQFVDAAHDRGIAVLLDLVLNHAYGTCPLVQMYWDSENNRPAANNPWFNTQSPNTSYFWGNDFNHESQYTKDFIDRANTYWMEEYKIDGFRFDFTKGFTNTPGDGWNYDQSRIDILKRMSDVIWESNPNAYVIFEHLAVNTEEKVLADYGIMLWGNLNHSYNQTTMGYSSESNFSGISYRSRGFADPNLVGYMESHDEERLNYKNQQYGNSDGADYDITDLNTALNRNEAAAAFFIPVPGPKMIWQFGELGYDYSINYCENGTIDPGCRVSPKPVKWDYYDNANRKRLYDVYAALIDLKLTEEAFSTSDFTLSVNSYMKKMYLNHEDMNVTILGNFNVTDGFITPNFQETGTWYDFFSGDSIVVNAVSDPLELKAGEYHIYTTKRLTKPEVVGVNEILYNTKSDVSIYPNPSSGQINISLFDKSLKGTRLVMYDLQGKRIKEFSMSNTEISFDVSDLEKGMYLITISTSEKTFVNKVLIN